MYFKKLSLNELFFMKCNFYFFKIAGVATMTLNINDPHKNDIKYSLFCPSKKGIIYNIFYICNAAVVFYICIYYMPKEFLIRDVGFETMMDFVHCALVIFTATYILIIFCLQQSTAISLANNIKSTIKRIEISTNHVCYKRRALLKKVGIVLLINFLLWILIYINMSRELTYTLYIIGLQMYNFAIGCLMIQYIITLNILQELYTIINDSLLDISKNSKHTSFMQTITNNNLEVELKKLSNLHLFCSQLRNICNDVSKFYSSSMLICVFYIFTTSIFIGYYIAKPLFLGINLLPVEIYIANICYQLPFTYTFIMITISVTDTINEVTFGITI